MSDDEKVINLDGEEVDPAIIPPKPTYRPNPNGKGADPEYMREVTAWRVRMQELRLVPRSGKARTRYTRAEVEEHALAEMLPKALKVLKAQLESPDERVQQSAAVKVLEYVKGKPVQQVQQQIQQVSAIRYESAAWQPGHLDTSIGFAGPTMLELEEADVEDAEEVE